MSFAVVSRRLETFCVVSSLFLLVVLSIYNMASSKTYDVSREGKNLRLRIAAADVTVSRLSRAFQASSCLINIIYHVVDSTFTLRVVAIGFWGEIFDSENSERR